MDKIKIKLDEFKHNIRLSLFVVIIGIIFMIMGAAIGLITESHEEQRGWNTYEVYTHPYADAASAIVILGFAAVTIGAIIGAYSEYEKDKLLKEKGLK